VAPYSAYFKREVPEEDQELTHVGPGTPGGEYLRRFWHPVGLSASLVDLPRAVRILGEDLVLFRDGSGQVGLLQLHCPHRGTSLEFGTVERRGLRCCYHGWLYGVDGRILETPGEPAESNVKDRFTHGAYPTHEYQGLIFAYMGPPDDKPPFPIYDTFAMPGYRMVPQWGEPTACNWLQQAENNMDPVHLVYLHRFEDIRARLDPHRPSVDPSLSVQHYVEVGMAQWEEDVRELREDTRRNHLFEWQEVPRTGFWYAWTRRIGGLVWVRVADVIPPNVDQIPRSLPISLESQELLFDPPRTTTWTVPVDDTSTITASFAYFKESPETGSAPGRFQFTGVTNAPRTYEDRQRQPGDWEALLTQRPIAVHALEHLAWSDTGVVMYRKRIRDGIRAVRKGESPEPALAATNGVIPTHARSTILRVPPAPTPEADRELLRATARRVLAGEFPKPSAATNGSTFP
jgi:nitrite reductase/ring-hydroxylating ferredoxin subunit